MDLIVRKYYVNITYGLKLDLFNFSMGCLFMKFLKGMTDEE